MLALPTNQETSSNISIFISFPAWTNPSLHPAMARIMGARIIMALSLFPLVLSMAAGGSNAACRDNERIALLKFKAGLTDPSSRLSSWSGLDCCIWAGVRCNNRTRHVAELRLHNPSTKGDSYIGGNISSSLLDLTHLRHLDLSGNNFHGSSIPEFIGSLTRLRYLNLSVSGFGGIIPHQLGNLTKLRYLDLSWFVSGFVDSLHWLSRLSSLQYLGLTQVDLSEAGVFSAISKLPALSVVRLSSCDLNSIPTSLPDANFSRLSAMDLSGNGLSSIPSWLFRLKSLEAIDLSENSLSGTISSFGNLSSLSVLRLGKNHFNLTMPKTIGSLCNLQVLDLSFNRIDLDISKFLEGLSGCAMNSLQTLDLGSNLLSGKLPARLGMFGNLSELRLGYNSLSGSIPELFGRLSSLRFFYLANNKLEGLVPESLWWLSELVVLDIGYNSLTGSISDAHLTNLTKLEALFLSSNSIVLNMSSGWVPPFQLKNIHLGSCVIGPRFPSWLKTQRTFSTIDISNGSIADSMPDWFWSLSSRVGYMNLSHNQISGSFPVSFAFTNISTIDVRSNQFHGPLPHIHGGVDILLLSDNHFSGNLLPVLGNGNLSLSTLLLSDNLVSGTIPQSICRNGMNSLDLANNFLSGEIPNCSMVSGGWYGLNLAHNNLSGQIPQWIGNLPYLQSLHLSNNNMQGGIPSLADCTSLLILDLGGNKLEGNIPEWIGGSLSSLMMLSLRSNMLHGRIPHQLSLLSHLQVLDLAENNLAGAIPPWLGNLTAMTSTKQTLIDIFPIFWGLSIR